MKKINWADNRNFSLLADFYEFTMSNGYLNCNIDDTISYFDLYFRNVPDKGGFVIASGLEQFVEYIENLKFSEEDINYFRSQNIFSENFLNFLKNFKFTCDVWAIPEGTPVFPDEPLLIVKGPIIQAQFLETAALIIFNHQSLIATKSNRIVRAANDIPIFEFGARRAQGADASVLGARAAYIGGVIGTSNTLSSKMYNITPVGTMAHSWVLMFDSEIEAFEAYANTFPENCLLLVDTYDTLKKGVPNAIKTFDKILKPKGLRPKGIRLDSGDVAWLSKEARKLLDNAGYEDAKIIVSNSLDEYIITDLLLQGAKIDGFGVGEKLITSFTSPYLGGVYKLCAIEKENKLIPKIKISENVEKITTPGFKKVIRFYNKDTNKAEADLICLNDENFDNVDEIEIFHPVHTWKRKVITNFYKKELLVQVYSKGNLIYKLPSLDSIVKYSKEEIDNLWDEVKRLDHAHIYIVDLSQKLWNLKQELLKKR